MQQAMRRQRWIELTEAARLGLGSDLHAIETRWAVRGALGTRRGGRRGLAAAKRATRYLPIARGDTRPLAAAHRPTGGAALGLVGEPLLSEVRLLTGREHKADGAVAAGQLFVQKAHDTGSSLDGLPRWSRASRC